MDAAAAAANAVSRDGAVGDRDCGAAIRKNSAAAAGIIVGDGAVIDGRRSSGSSGVEDAGAVGACAIPGYSAVIDRQRRRVPDGAAAIWHAAAGNSAVAYSNNPS